MVVVFFAYFCGGYKNNIVISRFRSSFKFFDVVLSNLKFKSFNLSENV